MRFITDATALTIRLEGWERVWALKKNLVVPLENIVDIDYLPLRPMMQDFAGYFRIPGTAIPLRFLAGSFWRKGDREFWYIRLQQAGVMTVELQPKVAGYERLRISCKPEIAQEVLDWWRAIKKK